MSHTGAVMAVLIMASLLAVACISSATPAMTVGPDHGDYAVIVMDDRTDMDLFAEVTEYEAASAKKKVLESLDYKVFIDDGGRGGPVADAAREVIGKEHFSWDCRTEMVLVIGEGSENSPPGISEAVFDPEFLHRFLEESRWEPTSRHADPIRERMAFENLVMSVKTLLSDEEGAVVQVPGPDRKDDENEPPEPEVEEETAPSSDSDPPGETITPEPPITYHLQYHNRMVVAGTGLRSARHFSERTPCTYRGTRPAQMRTRSRIGSARQTSQWSESDMDRKIKIAAVAIVAVCIVALVAATIVTDDGTGETYSITYVLDGGTNSTENPAEYASGTVTELHNPSKEGMVFSGWYLDESLETECERIDADMTGDLTLYAGWSTSIAGHGFVLSLSGTIRDGLFTSYSISGENTYRYLYYSESKEAYYVEYSSETVYSMGFSSSTYTDSSTYWTGEDDEDVTWEYLYNETISTIDGNKECEVWVATYASGATETQWIGDGWVPYRVVYSTQGYFGNSTTITYVCTETFTFETESDCEVYAYSGDGIDVSGGGTYHPGDTVTLTAVSSDGATFAGWYDENMGLITTDSTYTFELGASDETLYALNSDTYDITYRSGEAVELDSGRDLDDATWTVLDESGGIVDTLTSATPTYTFEDAGEYTLLVDGSIGTETYHRVIFVLADGTVTKTYEWVSGGRTYTYSLDIAISDVLYYRDYYALDQRVQDISGSHARDKTFVTYEDEYIQKIASDFTEMTAGMTDLERMNMVLAFTQYIEYQSDEVYMGSEEYWKFPLETLFDQGGDCEDTSILFSAIVKAMGYDTALLIYEGHMAAAVVVDGATANYTIEGYRLSYCETTSTGYSVGEVPQSIRFSRIQAYVII